MSAFPDSATLVLSGSTLDAVYEAQQALLSPSLSGEALGACSASLRRLFETPFAAVRTAHAPNAPLTSTFARCVRDLPARPSEPDAVCSTRATDGPTAAFFRTRGFEHVLYAHTRAETSWAGVYVAFRSASAPLFGDEGCQLLYLLLPALHSRAERSAAATPQTPRSTRLRMPSRHRLHTQHGLTEREAEVALLVAEGLTSKEIALRLDVSPNTVRRHSERVLEKLGLHARSGVALALMRLG